MSAKVSGGMAAARSMLEGRSRADSCRMMLLDRFQIAGLGRLNRTLNAAAKLRNSKALVLKDALQLSLQHAPLRVGNISNKHIS